MDHNELKRVIEALIFAADAPLVPERIRETLEACSDEEIAQVVETLNGEYEAAGHAFMIRAVAGGYQVTTRPQFSNWIKKLYLGRQKGRLSQAALESLAIIAFKQPISRVDIAQIRGVNSDGVIGTLLERKLVTISGRSEGVGRPLLYSTTPEFLEFFGINDLTELPKPREIEELIGKEGMSEEVLQALSSDKQLKLPISFEPEAGGDETAQSESGIATLSPEQIVEALALQPHAEAAVGDVPERYEGRFETATEAAAPDSELEGEGKALSDDASETSDTSNLPELSQALDNEATAAAVDEEMRRADAPELLVSQEEPLPLDERNEGSDEATADASESPQAEDSATLPMREGKKRKRGKRVVTDDHEESSAEASVPDTASSQTVERDNLTNVVSDDEAAETTSEEEHVTDHSEEKSAPEISAAALEENEVDSVAIAEEEPAAETEAPFFVAFEQDVPEATSIAASEVENLSYEEAARVEDSLPEHEEPQVVSFHENRSVQIIETPAHAERREAEQEIEVRAHSEIDETVANTSTATWEDEPERQVAPEVSTLSTFEVAAPQSQHFTPSVSAETDSAESAQDKLGDNDIAEKFAEAEELDAWPEVTEVRVEEPSNLAEEFHPVALSDMREEPAVEASEHARPAASEKDSSAHEEAHDRETAHSDFAAISPTIRATNIADDAVTTPPSGAAHKEQQRAAQPNEIGSTSATERHEANASRDEENVFFA